MAGKAWQRPFQGSTGELGPLLAQALEADSRSRSLLASDSFRRTVDKMSVVVVSTGITALFGASTMGHAFVGALSYCLPTARAWVPGTAEPVLLVDAVVASAQGLEAAADYATRLGATELAALVVAVIGDHEDPLASFGPIVSIGEDLVRAA